MRAIVALLTLTVGCHQAVKEDRSASAAQSLPDGSPESGALLLQSGGAISPGGAGLQGLGSDYEGPHLTMTLSHTEAGDDRLMDQQRPRYLACYRKALAATPGMTGKLELTVTVHADGTATGTVKSASGVSPELSKCMVDEAARAVFDPGPERTFDAEIAVRPERRTAP